MSLNVVDTDFPASKTKKSRTRKKKTSGGASSNPTEGLKMIVCVVCGLKLENQIILFQHFMSLHVAEVYQCVHCAEKFDDEEMLEEHLQVVHDDRDGDCLGLQGNSYGDAPLGSSKKSKSSKRKPKKKKSQNAGNVVVKKELDDEWDANEDQFAIEGNYYSDEEDEPILKSRKRKRQKLNHVSDDDFPVPIKVETELYEEGEEEYIDDEEDDSNSDQFSVEDDEDEVLRPVKKRQKRSPRKRAGSSSKTVHTCTDCPLVFKSKIALGVHRKRSHGLAKKTSEDDEDTTEAAAATPSSITLDCEICNKTMSLNLIYTHHILPATNADGRDVYSCDVCAEEFVTKKAASRHVRVNHTTKNLGEFRKKIEDSKKFSCKLCKIRFSRKITMDKHNKIYHPPTLDGISIKSEGGGPPISAAAVAIAAAAFAVTSSSEARPCPICDEKVASGQTFTHHVIASDKSDDVFTCNICMEEFSVKQMASRHVKNDHMTADESIEDARASFRSNFFCNICQKSMPRDEKFSHHISSSAENDKSSRYSCNICSTICANLEDCQKHLSIKHYNLAGISKVDSFHCKECDKSVMESERYSHHTEVSTRVDESGNTITIFTCNICNKEFTNLKFCKLHMVNHLVEPKRTDKITFFCKICNKTITSHDRWSHHIIITKDERNKPIFTCDVCNKSYDKVRNVRAHLSGFHVYVMCETCGKDVAFGSIKKHHLTHTQPPPTCTDCNEIFKDSAIYRKHMKDVHDVIIPNHRAEQPSNQKIHLCDSCGKGFKWRTDLAVHVRTHISELCTVCNQVVTCLKVHMKKKHLKEVSVKCTVCGIRCTSEANMAKHMKMNHMGQNNFECNYCEERFPSMIKRIEHMSDVHGLKHMLERLKCEICGKIVASKQSKEKHMMAVHGGNKPFACTQCDKTFSEHTSLKTHIDRVHNKVRNFPCIHCGKALVNQTRLKYHINRFHNGLMPPPSEGDHNGEDQMKDESSSGLHHEEYYNHYSN